MAEPANDRLCTCDSGLSSTRCCRLNLRTLGAAAASRHRVTLEDRAVQAHAAGQYDEAERLAIDTLELAPNRTSALAVLYGTRKAQGRGDAGSGVDRPPGGTGTE